MCVTIIERAHIDKSKDSIILNTRLDSKLVILKKIPLRNFTNNQLFLEIFDNFQKAIKNYSGWLFLLIKHEKSSWQLSVCYQLRSKLKIDFWWIYTRLGNWTYSPTLKMWKLVIKSLQLFHKIWRKVHLILEKWKYGKWRSSTISGVFFIKQTKYMTLT